MRCRGLISTSAILTDNLLRELRLIMHKKKARYCRETSSILAVRGNKRAQRGARATIKPNHFAWEVTSAAKRNR